MILRQCYIHRICQQKEIKEIMGYPKKHRGRRKMGSKKRRARKKNKKK
jgi:hypothetical protein